MSPRRGDCAGIPDTTPVESQANETGTPADAFLWITPCGAAQAAPHGNSMTLRQALVAVVPVVAPAVAPAAPAATPATAAEDQALSYSGRRDACRSRNCGTGRAGRAERERRCAREGRTREGECEPLGNLHRNYLLGFLFCAAIEQFAALCAISS